MSSVREVVTPKRRCTMRRNHLFRPETYSVGVVNQILEFTPIAAGVFAIPPFIPQLRIVQSATRSTASPAPGAR